ncbi:EAL domain-containing protein [Sulfurimonas sp. SAG-AH-194-C21]|nr:GGDEF and EAL domain-containing protein [Sulfurimonas sp. SAG-AH-194-C21]MDF1883864.1 EAL domain-containing protein [Sulfurimonas sp. SAG-AH-194-C21]
MNDELVFAPEATDKLPELSKAFKVMIIDDDNEVHAFTKLALKSFQYNNHKIDFISVYSEKEAREVLPLHDDIAVILLDVVMETNTSGLDIAKFIRSELHNDMSRIIIRTGQPGEAPERYVIDNYDINDYKEKTELTTDKLYTTIRTALVQYTQLIELLNKKNEIYNLLVTDKLTSLPNRKQLIDDLDSTKPQTLMLIDIDGFSLLNDVYGFDVGDQVLIHLSVIVTKVLKPNMTLYRLEADLFAISVQSSDKSLLENEVATVKTLLDNSPFELNDLSLYIRVSIGIVNYQLGNIIQKAEIALRQAREVSRNRVEYYDESKDYFAYIEENNNWTTRIAHALKHDNILVYFQPIVECATNKIVKYEALVRLKYEEEIYSPFHFLPTARYAGYLHQITQRVFEKSCQKFQNNDLMFSINITDHDLAENDFIEYITMTSKKYNINSSRVVFEILEETSMNGNIVATENLNKLTALGYSLSIDDFGAECSNFSQLGKHSYESIKIDGSFIKDIDTNKTSQIITESILFFTNRIGFKTVAEYVHSKEIYEIVKGMGVDYAQGYYFGEPKPELIN